MRNTLLTTTALVLSAGIASADGHATITWSGAATAGLSREGKSAAAAQGKQNASSIVALAAAVADTADTADTTNAANKTGTSTNTVTDLATYKTHLLAQIELALFAIEAVVDNYTGAITLTSATTPIEAEVRADITALTTAISGANKNAAETVILAAEQVKLNKNLALLNGLFGSAVVAEGTVGKFQTYSEVNATVTGAVALDNGMSISASMSVDAGNGYDFADDDGHDSIYAVKTNGVSLDSITLDAGALGAFKIDENAVAHLVDGDDDAAADILYTNTFGGANISVAMDVSEDTDLAARKAADSVVYTVGVDNGASTLDYAGFSTATIIAARAADVQWSAKISMPVAGGSAYIAMDEEGGNIFGASTTLGGIGLSFDSKLEALEEELSIDRSNSLGLTYALGATTLGATWNSVEDGDQWGISAAYAADGMTITASTDEGSDWAVSGSVALATGASIVGGVNYTEDAYLGLSFAF